MPSPTPPFALRIPPMGPPVVADNVGDGLIWQGTGWSTGPLSAGETEFDFLISDRADLVSVVAPVGGVFSLPSGSYFFKESVDLDTGERVEVDANDVFMMGGGQSRGFNGNAGGSTPALTLVNGAQVQLFNMTVGAVNPNSHGVSVTESTLRAWQTNIPSTTIGTQPSLRLAADSVAELFNCTLSGVLEALVITGGTSAGHKFTDCSLQAGVSGIGVTISVGSLDTLMEFTRCAISGSAPTTDEAMSATGTALDLFMLDCVLTGPAASPTNVFNVGALSSLNMRGGLVRNTSGAPGDGIVFAGNVAGGVQLIGVAAEALDDFIIRTGGTQNRVVIAECDSAADVAVGVDWQTANVPTNGLLEVGNQFNTSTPFQNHASTDARVNRKCNSLQGGLSTETAIVP